MIITNKIFKQQANTHTTYSWKQGSKQNWCYVLVLLWGLKCHFISLEVVSYSFESFGPVTLQRRFKENKKIAYVI